MKRSPLRKRTGMTLLEVMAATTIMATLMASVVVLVRSSYAVWQAHEADMEAAETAYATLRHVVRNGRQATQVAAISSAASTSGNLALLMDTGETLLWEHSSPEQEVRFGSLPGTADQILAGGVSQLSFLGYEADGSTVTSVLDDIRAIKVTVQVTMPAGGGTTRSVSSWVWLRTW